MPYIDRTVNKIPSNAIKASLDDVSELYNDHCRDRKHKEVTVYCKSTITDLIHKYRLNDNWQWIIPFIEIGKCYVVKKKPYLSKAKEGKTQYYDKR